uniref:Spondin-1 n=1 Tax=Romanomermis culicivorax TaxID=13658 RepID=A0A915I763_ROMCU
MPGLLQIGISLVLYAMLASDLRPPGAHAVKQHKVRSVLGSGANCQLTPDRTETLAPKTPGTNGFKILIKPHPIPDDDANALEPDGYVPGEYYTIVLEGWRTQYTVQTFRGFSLAAVDENATSLDQPMGAFQVKDSEIVRWSPQCYHAVSHTSLHPKTHVEMVWQAPSLSAGGCVKFRAMILEYKDLWYADEGLLAKKFCRAEGEFKAAATPEECCACDEAKYEMTMTGYWSKETHPKDFPTCK